MKKRIATLVVALLTLVCLVCMPSMATEEDPVLLAGYAAVDITPELGLPLMGYGDPTRLSTENEGNLYVTCIALTDNNNVTALFIGVDTMNTNQQWSNNAKDAVVAALGADVINIDRIYISASSTMSAPEMIYTGTDEEIKAKIDAYRERVIAACATAAQNAMADRTAVEMSVGKINTSAVIAERLSAKTGETVNDGDVVTRLIYSTHYKVTKDEQSWVAGVGFGPTVAINSNNYTVSETFKAYDTLAMLQFTPVDGSKQPIVLANWAAKANLTSTTSIKYGALNHTTASADYVGYFRDALNQTQGVRTAFFQSTSGNTSAFSLDFSEQNPNVMEEITYTDGEGNPQTVSTVTPNMYGKALAAMATYGLNNSMVSKDTPVIRNMKVRFATEPAIPTTEQIALVNALKTAPYTIEETDPEDEGNDSTEYATLYDYLLENWDQKATYETGYPELAKLTQVAQLSAINTRMAHTIGANTTNFATDAVYCDTSVLTLGDVTLAMAPVDLYDNYGVSDGAGGYIKTWSKSGVDFILGATNGNSGALPSYVCYTYNSEKIPNNGVTYYQGTNVTLTTPFSELAGERLMETYANIKKTLNASEADPTNQIITQCECGGLAVGKPGHTCEDKQFSPWYDPDSFPVDGNYYLVTDVTLYGEARTGVGHKCIDLKGHTITRKVLPEVLLDQTLPSEGAKYYGSTRLFAMESDARLTVTDTSAEGTGKLTRDISALDDYGTDDNAKITNYGLLIAIIDGNVNDHVVYKAILDADGQVSGGGACVANMSYKDQEVDGEKQIVHCATFTMYDGTMIGGIADNGSAFYGNGVNNLYGGTITAATAGKNGTVRIVSSGKLLLAGNTIVSGNKTAEGKESNICISSSSLTVDPGYTGTAGISIHDADDPNGHIIGKKLEETTDEHLKAHLTVDNYPTYCVTTCEGIIMTAEVREYCICGGKAHGEHAHEQELVSWKPWPVAYNSYLPSATYGGNYYLLTNINTASQRSVLATLHLDLNGHNITHKVDPENESFPQNTRVFFVSKGGTLTITDSTTDSEKVGTITRDLSLLTEEQKAAINNYGLIILLNEEADGDCILFDGILDATGQVSGGGACVANLTKNVYFRMYGGTLKGGIANTGGCLYSSGPVELHDGTITGGKATGVTGAGGIAIVTLTLNNNYREGSLSICGNVNVTGNVGANDQPSNIRVNTGYKNFNIADDFEGEIGITLLNQPMHNMPVAVGNTVNLNNATITADNYAERFKFNVENGYLLAYMDAATITNGEGTVYYDTLQEALDAAEDNNPIVLQRPVDEETLTLAKDTYLNLNGWDLNNTTFNDGGFKLYVLDTETDDYTITEGEKHYTYDADAKDYVLAVGNGYGIMTGAAATAAQSAGEGWNVILAGAEKPIDLYLKITENETDVSFHRLNLRMAGITLRPDSMEDGSYWPGLYYNSQFGGDEVIKRNITTYGVGMSAVAGEALYQRSGSYTELSADGWKIGTDKNGNSNNLANGTILTGIMKDTNVSMINRRNGSRAVRGQNYVIVNDGNNTRVVGPEISLSLQDVFEGNGITGIDANFENAYESTKTSVLKLYKIYNGVMKLWNLPNIEAAYNDAN